MMRNKRAEKGVKQTETPMPGPPVHLNLSNDEQGMFYQYLGALHTDHWDNFAILSGCGRLAQIATEIMGVERQLREDGDLFISSRGDIREHPFVRRLERLRVEEVRTAQRIGLLGQLDRRRSASASKERAEVEKSGAVTDPLMAALN
jgi:hypothetical protein